MQSGAQVAQRIIATTGNSQLSQSVINQLMHMSGKQDAARTLLHAYRAGRLSTTLLADVLPRAWSYFCEYPNDALTDSEWLEMFSATGYISDNGMCPSNPVRLYRGAAPQYRQNWSWTDDESAALAFAELVQGRVTGVVWTAVVEPGDILMRISRSEFANTTFTFTEYVVDTSRLSIQRAPLSDADIHDLRRAWNHRLRPASVTPLRSTRLPPSLWV